MALKTLRKCRKCSLDCSVTREMTLLSIAKDKRDEYKKKLFDDEPMYTPTNCPK